MHYSQWFIILIAANGLILLLLAVNVSRLRLKHKVSYGDGGNKHLMKAIRVHSNGTEQVPIYALVILALTYTDTSNSILSYLVIAFTSSRVIHAYGMLYKQPMLRQAGAAITYVSQGAAMIALLIGLST